VYRWDVGPSTQVLKTARVKSQDSAHQGTVRDGSCTSLATASQRGNIIIE